MRTRTEPPEPELPAATRLALRGLYTGLDLALQRARTAHAAGDIHGCDAALDEADELLSAIIKLLPATSPFGRQP